MTHNILDVPIIMWSCNVFLYKLVIHFKFERTQDCTTWTFLYEIFEEVVWTYCGHTHDIHRKEINLIKGNMSIFWKEILNIKF